MIVGATARTASSPTPMRSATPGQKFCTKTSAVAASLRSTTRPATVLRSITAERFERLLWRNEAETLPRRLAPARVWSPPPGASTLMMSAPWSPNIMVASGPEIIEVRSRTRMESSDPGICDSARQRSQFNRVAPGAVPSLVGPGLRRGLPAQPRKRDSSASRAVGFSSAIQ